MTPAAMVERTVFSTPRAAEFLELRALQAQTGQPVGAFGDVVIKELLDNALDAAEAAGRPPVVELSVEHGADDMALVTVADNGAGISADTVARICDFNYLVSDKARYRGPTRGAQGNALKTLLGIPHALGVEGSSWSEELSCAAVAIDSRGVRHRLLVSVDAVGEVVIDHDRAAGQRTVGAAITVPVRGVDLDPMRWAYGTALVNPHAAVTAIEHGHDDRDPTAEVYKPQVQGWSKWTPAMPASPRWYDPAAFSALIHSHIRQTRQGGADVPLGRFISEFEGLSGSAKQKKIRAAAPRVTHLSDLEADDATIAALHAAMLAHCRPSSPARLGPVGRQHLETMFLRFGVRRFWYRAVSVVEDGVPWVIEAAVADTNRPGGVWFGCNHSATFGDPLGRTRLHGGEVHTTGAAAFLAAAGVDYAHRAAVVHVICAAPQFMDKGKVALAVPAAVADGAAAALESTTKVLRREDDQRRRDARRAARAERRARDDYARAERAQQWSLKDAVFDVLPEAKRSAGYVVSARTLYYKVRPLVQAHTDRELDFSYFSQTLLPDYERTIAPLPGLYYEARGYLYHPHDRSKIPLGTREVESYVLPPWQFDKILYVEKEGLDTQLEPYELAEKYDMAIAFGKGYAVTACRNLLARSDLRTMPIFVLHDADPAGYNIARTLAAETRRMPEHRIDVIDLGLTVPQAVDLNLETERFVRRVALPADLELDQAALAWFTGSPIAAGRSKTHYEATRCELNALSSDELAAFIEDGLARHGADTKLIPPEEVLADYADSCRSDNLRQLVANEVARRINMGEVVTSLAAEYADQLNVDADMVAEAFNSDPTLSWRGAVGRHLDTAALSIDGLPDHIAALVSKRITGSRS